MQSKSALAYQQSLSALARPPMRDQARVSRRLSACFSLWEFAFQGPRLARLSLLATGSLTALFPFGCPSPVWGTVHPSAKTDCWCWLTHRFDWNFEVHWTRPCYRSGRDAADKIDCRQSPLNRPVAHEISCHRKSAESSTWICLCHQNRYRGVLSALVSAIISWH